MVGSFLFWVDGSVAIGLPAMGGFWLLGEGVGEQRWTMVKASSNLVDLILCILVS